MIGQRRETLLAQEGGKIVDLLARHAVDDAGVPTALGKKTEQLLAWLLLGNDAIEDVRPVETGEKPLGVLQMQALDDLLAGAHVRRGSQRDTWDARKQLSELTQLHVLGAEVM